MSGMFGALEAETGKGAEMSTLRVRAFAEKVVNKGGGIKGINKVVVKEMEIKTKDKDGKDVSFNQPYTERVHEDVKTTGSDYVVFICPKCGKRNKRCAYDAKTEDKGKYLLFRCNSCLIDVEVSRPVDITITDAKR